MTTGGIMMPSVFESFNARNLSPNQVAYGFIPPHAFDELILRRHSLVIGPRGSGKTTLLKMLQLPALLAWKHEQADEYRRKIDFTGVFVPADVSWGAQIKAVGVSKKLPTEASKAIGLAAFTTHVLMALVDSMRDCLNSELNRCQHLKRHFVSLSKDQEAELVASLSENWRLTPSVKSLHGLKLALRNRLSLLAEFPQRVIGLPHSDILAELRASRDMHLAFVQAAVFAIEAFNELAGQRDRHWGFLFDELEIAPDEIRQELIRALRSTDQRLIFKLSISPYSQDVNLLKTSVSAMPDQDFQPIELWYPRKEAGYEFSRALLDSMLSDLGLPVVDPDDIFDSSYFESDAEGIGSTIGGYKPGGRVHKRFKALAERDQSFSDYLQRNNVNLETMHQMPENVKAGTVRKVVSLVEVREAFRGARVSNSSDVRQRSRKNPELFTGAQTLFAIVEGNPRWFIGLIGGMLRDYAAAGHRIPRSAQARAVTTSTNRFRALLRTVPIMNSENQRTPAFASRGLLGLLDHIGGTLHKNVVVKPFTDEPVLSFVVDSNTSNDVMEALGKALNAGAIILVPDENSETLISSLRGKRFRLSYMLAAGYGLPITLGRAGSLSSILEAEQGEKKVGQLKMWGDE